MDELENVSLTFREEFQSPSGDSLFSDEHSINCNGCCHFPRFNPLAGIRCFLTERKKRETGTGGYCFNPLAGIRCFLTLGLNLS